MLISYSTKNIRPESPIPPRLPAPAGRCQRGARFPTPESPTIRTECGRLPRLANVAARSWTPLPLWLLPSRALLARLHNHPAPPSSLALYTDTVLGLRSEGHVARKFAGIPPCRDIEPPLSSSRGAGRPRCTTKFEIQRPISKLRVHSCLDQAILRSIAGPSLGVAASAECGGTALARGPRLRSTWI